MKNLHYFICLYGKIILNNNKYSEYILIKMFRKRNTEIWYYIYKESYNSAMTQDKVKSQKYYTSIK